MLKNGLIRKIRVFSKFMASQSEKLTMAIHILPNISWSKVKSDSKSGKLIEKKNFCWKIIHKMWGRNYQQSKILYALFLLYVLVKNYRNILKLSGRQPAFTSCKSFVKNKERSGTALPISFFAWFLKKNISQAMLY